MIGDAFEQATQQLGPHAFQPDVNQRYNILAASDLNFSLDASRNPWKYGDLIVWEYHGKENQQWRFIPDGNGNYTIRNVGMNMAVIHIPDFSNAKLGTHCKVGFPVDGIFEKWRIYAAQGPSEGKGYMIVSAYNGMVLDVAGGNN